MCLRSVSIWSEKLPINNTSQVPPPQGDRAHRRPEGSLSTPVDATAYGGPAPRRASVRRGSTRTEMCPYLQRRLTDSSRHRTSAPYYFTVSPGLKRNDNEPVVRVYRER